jgi:hypothetical protein
MLVMGLHPFSDTTLNQLFEYGRFGFQILIALLFFVAFLLLLAGFVAWLRSKDQPQQETPLILPTPAPGQTITGYHIRFGL